MATMQPGLEHGAREETASAAEAMGGVVLVSYVFPPCGGAGVQRVAKLARYLPLHGLRSVVLTCSNPSAPVQDRSMLDDIPAEVEVVRARTLEPGYRVKQAAWNARARQRRGPLASLRSGVLGLARHVLLPDPQLLWQPAAHLALRAVLKRGDIDAVLISGPPFSSFLLAPLVRASKVAVVLDYRDEWSTYRTAYEMMPRHAAPLMSWLERSLLRRADAVVTATAAFRRNLLAQHPWLAPHSVWVIPNGYDPSDVPEDLGSPPADRLVVTYAGTVFRLTSARGLLRAVRLLHEREPQLARRLEVRFFGRVVDTELDAFEGTESLGVSRHGYVEHARVFRELAQSHLALCLLDEVAGADRIYPAKIFELMYLRRPVLALTPPGELASLVQSHRLGEVVAPRDHEAIAALLLDKLRQLERGTLARHAEPVGVEAYDRRAQAGQFAAVLRAARRRAHLTGR
jgi:glycosyltransferase involved in cell wall biosynthesis